MFTGLIMQKLAILDFQSIPQQLSGASSRPTQPTILFFLHQSYGWKQTPYN